MPSSHPPHAASGPASASPDWPPPPSSVPGPSWSSPRVSLRVAQSGRWSPALDEASLHPPPATCPGHSLPSRQLESGPGASG